MAALARCLAVLPRAHTAPRRLVAVSTARRCMHGAVASASRPCLAADPAGAGAGAGAAPAQGAAAGGERVLTDAEHVAAVKSRATRGILMASVGFACLIAAPGFWYVGSVATAPLPESVDPAILGTWQAEAEAEGEGESEGEGEAKADEAGTGSGAAKGEGKAKAAATRPRAKLQFTTRNLVHYEHVPEPRPADLLASEAAAGAGAGAGDGNGSGSRSGGAAAPAPAAGAAAGAGAGAGASAPMLRSGSGAVKWSEEAEEEAGAASFTVGWPLLGRAPFFVDAWPEQSRDADGKWRWRMTVDGVRYVRVRAPKVAAAQ